MSKVILDAATAKALIDAGPGAELYSPDGQPLGHLYPPDLLERLAFRASQPPPRGFATMDDYYQWVRENTPRADLERAAASDSWITHDEAMRRLGLA